MTLNMVASPVTVPNAQNTQALKKVWAGIHLESCPYHYNFHMHTVCSDGKLTPEGLLEQALTIGLKGFAITDHHSVKGYQIAQRKLEEIRLQKPETRLPHLWTGLEVTSNLLGTEVHILGYAFDPEHWVMEPYLQGDRPSGMDAYADNVIDAIHQAGGLAVLAHPARYHRPAQELIPAVVHMGIDGVEAYYAYGNPKPWKASLKETEQVKQMSEIYGLYTTCGTDTHGMNLLQRI
jgi:predicted metal-dependent phosphoesterase TrpH